MSSSWKINTKTSKYMYTFFYSGLLNVSCVPTIVFISTSLNHWNSKLWMNYVEGTTVTNSPQTWSQF